ncbi:hypothetical protein FTO74_04790 [Granulicella sp. WH15]|nr:hypothetical protein FTO74_04790 [Granulicella sp. WH15]
MFGRSHRDSQRFGQAWGSSSMKNRTVIQWDKEDCADIHIIKVDLLGAGMIAFLSDCVNWVSRVLWRQNRPRAVARRR